VNVKTLRNLFLVLLGILAAAGAGAASAGPAADPQESELATRVRKEILGLPYYGVFDLITFEVGDEGVVTLGGYVYEAVLQKTAEKTVRKVEGVTEVRNRIEVLPVSISDDDLRWGVYWAIYRDSPLSRYGSAVDMIGGWRPGFRPWGRGFRRWDLYGRPPWSVAPFWGMEPLGSHAIHILVKGGAVSLVGVVDHQADKDLAALKARGVFGVRAVENAIEVAPDAP
jgi:hyperosmotically inducible protein